MQASLKRKSLLSILACVLIILLLTLICMIAIFDAKGNKMEKIHVLKSPMIIGSDSDRHYYLLPKGTYLYYDSTFPEGFTRYKVYINVDKSNASPFPLTDNVDGVEAPLTAYPVTKEDLLEMLQTIKFDKDEIKSIISNGHFSEEDKKEIANFIQQKG